MERSLVERSLWNDFQAVYRGISGGRLIDKVGSNGSARYGVHSDYYAPIVGIIRATDYPNQDEAGNPKASRIYSILNDPKGSALEEEVRRQIDYLLNHAASFLFDPDKN